MKNSFKLTE
ncbi:Protein of unknown function [Bacillus thuringiensis]|uniref:Uncharacterized protein n=1 Tax=Bacillus thuringiensis TaxID=1428 RepID=A0A1C4F899_BACTU|nr:Protein of unknown function [Bacillus thuringiensis]